MEILSTYLRAKKFFPLYLLKKDQQLIYIFKISFD